MYLELLLGLSGHPTPLFHQDAAKHFPLLTSAEASLLRSLGQLAELYRASKSHLQIISRHHSSVICRATASHAHSSGLRGFQDAIVDFERRVLVNDKSTTGHDGIVSLAAVVSNFSPWRRRLQWYWHIACLMCPPDDADKLANRPSSATCNGAQLIDALCKESVTGYPDVEECAIHLRRVAETVWLRQLSMWILTGSAGADAGDFFIEEKQSSNSSSGFLGHSIDEHCKPAFLNRDTAESLLYIGRTLKYIEKSRASPKDKGDVVHSDSIQSRVLLVKPLQGLATPIMMLDLAAAILKSRNAVSRQLVDGTLPIHELSKTLVSLHQFCLGACTDFHSALIYKARRRLENTSSKIGISTSRTADRILAGTIMRQDEVSKVLSDTWTAMAAASGIEDTPDAKLEWPREHLQLRVASIDGELSEASDDATKDNKQDDIPKDRFNDFLLPVPTALLVQVKAPLNLFLGYSETKIYAVMSSYLLAIRRSYMQVTDLWRESTFRRGAAFYAGERTNYKYRMHSSQKLRLRALQREHALKPTWITLSLAAFLLGELMEYLNVEVVEQSWTRFQTWLSGRSTSHPQLSQAVNDKDFLGASFGEEESDEHPQQPRTSSDAQSHSKSGMTESQSDPELVADAHRLYLTTLLDNLLLTQSSYADSLRTLLLRIDQIVALVLRLRLVHRNLDLHDEGVDDSFADKYAKEEREVYGEIDSALKQVRFSLRTVSEELAQMQQRDLGGRSIHKSVKPTVFEPWAEGGVDRLLMKLDLQALTSAG